MSKLIAFLFLAGCAAEPAEDGVNDSFAASGKTDTGGIQDGTPEADGVLALVNSASLSLLDADVGLAKNAASNIVEYRLGDDEIAGTADDQRFDTLAELDAVPFVGPVAFKKLLVYAQANGYVMTTPSSPPATDPATSDPPAMDPAATGNGTEAASCYASDYAWNQTCFSWKPCDYPVEHSYSERAANSVSLACTLVKDALTCNLSSTECKSQHSDWWLPTGGAVADGITMSGKVAADGSFSLIDQVKIGNDANYGSHTAKISGRLDSGSLVVDKIQYDYVQYQSGINSQTSFRNTEQRGLNAGSIRIPLN